MTDRNMLARLITEHCFDAVEMVRCDCAAKLPSAEAWAMHLSQLIEAAYLVVPRSNIVGTEYGCRRSDEDLADLTESRDTAIAWALERREWQREAEFELTAEVVARPSLPWSVIPLPEDGTP